MEGLIIVEERYDTQAHCAQQEYPVSPHFHPGKRKGKRNLDSLNMKIKYVFP